MTAVELSSSLPPEECERRLTAAIDSGWKLFGAAPAIGSARGGKLNLRKRIRYRNSFQTVLRARMLADGAGTRLICRFGMHPLVIAFMVLWFFGALSAVFFNLARIVSEDAKADSWFAIPVILLFPAAAVAIVAVGRWLARDEQKFLIDFVCRIIEARVVASPIGS